MKNGQKEQNNIQSVWDLKEFQIWNDLIFVRRGWRVGREGRGVQGD